MQFDKFGGINSNFKLKSILRIIFLVVFCGLSQFTAQVPVKETVYVSFQNQINKMSPVKGDTIELKVTGTIKEGFYMYGSQFEAEGPIKTELKIENKYGLREVGVLVCADCKTKYDDIWEGNISYSEHQIVFSQRYIVEDPAFLLKGKIEGQACKTDGICVQVEGIVDVKGASKEVEAQKKSPEKDKDPEETSQKIVPKQLDKSFWEFIFLAISGGILAVLTPCVYPMLPMTVTFFLKRNHGNRTKAVFEALMYGSFIIFIYTGLGLLTSVMFGEGALNDISTHWLPNLIFFIVFITFGLSFLGLFEITLPNSLINKMDQKSEKGGFLGIFFMAFTLVLISFSCTGPIASSLLVGAANGDFWKPTIGMFAFSATFALPFMIFALFPNLLNSLPRSGSWLNTVKVTLGLVELALAFKFINQADPDNEWGILSRDIFIVIHMVVAFVIGLYLLGIVNIGYENTENKVGPIRAVFGIGFFILAFYLLPGLFGAKLRGLSGYLPSYNVQEFKMEVQASTAKANYGCGEPIHFEEKHVLEGISSYFEYYQALNCAKDSKKLLFVNFTGKSCANCRRMEEEVFSRPDIKRTFEERFVFVSLFTDEPTELPQSEWVVSKIDGEYKKTIGAINKDIEKRLTGLSTQPFYIIVDPEAEKVMYLSEGYSSYETFKEFLESGSK